jgi:hypothetical protein
MKKSASLKEAQSFGPGEIYKDGDTEYRWYAPGEIVRPEPDANPVPQEVTAYQAAKALYAAGLAEAYEAWANDPDRTFLERAAVTATTSWVRSDETLIAAATELGLTAEQLDDLFRLAATL